MFSTSAYHPASNSKLACASISFFPISMKRPKQTIHSHEAMRPSLAKDFNMVSTPRFCVAHSNISPKTRIFAVKDVIFRNIVSFHKKKLPLIYIHRHKYFSIKELGNLNCRLFSIVGFRVTQNTFRFAFVPLHEVRNTRSQRLAARMPPLLTLIHAGCR